MKDATDSHKKKKQKKHKKHKKSSKSERHDKESTSATKKHKRHKHKSSRRDSDSAADDGVVDKSMAVAAPGDKAAIKPPPPPSNTTTLSSKFTEIMKSNGHTAAAPTLLSKKPASVDHKQRHISTNESGQLVDQITKSTLRHRTPPPAPVQQRIEIVSSNDEQDDDEEADSEGVLPDSDVEDNDDSPDVAVIEDEELNLEDLMKQKALLQACLGTILSETDEQLAAAAAEKAAAAAAAEAAAAAAAAAEQKTIAESSKQSRSSRKAAEKSDVILLDDSDDGAAVADRRKRERDPSATAGGKHKTEVHSGRQRHDERSETVRPAASKRTPFDEPQHDRRTTSSNEASSARQRHASSEREGRGRVSSDQRGGGQHGNGGGGGRDNRHKEDLRTEIDRDRRGAPPPSASTGDRRDARDSRDSRDRGGRGGGGADLDPRGLRGGGQRGSRYSMERDASGRRDGGDRNDRNRYGANDRGNVRGRSRDRYDRRNDDRDRDRGGDRRRNDRDGAAVKDKFVGSLSEGQRIERDSDSDTNAPGRRSRRATGKSAATAAAAAADVDDDNDDDDDEDDEEKIIEMRRRKREELLRKLAHTSAVVSPTKAQMEADASSATAGQRKRKLSDQVERIEAAAVKMPKSVDKPLADKDQSALVEQAGETVELEATPPSDAVPATTPAAAEPMDVNEGTANNDEDSKEKRTKEAPATKKNDWDMFAEQDCDSNFDVSRCGHFDFTIYD